MPNSTSILPYQADFVKQGALVPLPDDIRRGLVKQDPIVVSCAMVEHGFASAAAPIPPGQKRPPKFFFGGTFANAITDPKAIPEVFALFSGYGVGLVLDRLVVLDDDAGNLDTAEYGISGTFGERTRRGAHHWVIPPAEANVAGWHRAPWGGEVRGRGSAVVISPSDGYQPYDVNRPIKVMTREALARITPQRHAAPAIALNILPRHRADADGVRQLLLTDRFGAGIAALYSGEWRRLRPDWSESERDACLVYCATYRTQDPNVLAALLFATGWPTDPHRSHPKPNPSDYVARTVANALAKRLASQQHSLSLVASRLGLPSQTVIDPTGSKRDMTEMVLRYVMATPPDELREGWTRVPISDIAQVLGVSPETIRRAVVALASSGQIETDVTTEWIGKPRKTRWARLTRLALMGSLREVA